MTEFNDRIIKEFRENNGRVDSAGFGSSLVLLHTRGAKTGVERINPAMSLCDGDDWLVVASAKGAPRDPAWAVNLRANPDIEIEVAIDGHIQTIPVRAVELHGDDYDAAFARFADQAQAFSTYQDRAGQAGRKMPVIRLTPRADAVGPTEDKQAGIAPDDEGRDLSVRRPDTDEDLPHYGVVGDTYTILLTGEDTAGRYALIDMHIPPGGGPPPHRHDFEEMFHVLEGHFEVTFRGERTVIGPGETINIPARAPHFFHNSSDADARVLCMIPPPGLEQYFTLWGQPLPTRTSPPDPAETEQRLGRAIELGPEFKIENLPPT